MASGNGTKNGCSGRRTVDRSCKRYDGCLNRSREANVGKGRRNQRNVDYYKVQGGAVEDRDAGRMSKQALATHAPKPKRKKAPPLAKVGPARPRAKKAAPKATTRQPQPMQPTRLTPPARRPTVTGAARYTLGALTRRVWRMAEGAVGAVRFAAHLWEAARGKETKE
jgi:hypothetical protein